MHPTCVKCLFFLFKCYRVRTLGLQTERCWYLLVHIPPFWFSVLQHVQFSNKQTLFPPQSVSSILSVVSPCLSLYLLSSSSPNTSFILTLTVVWPRTNYTGASEPNVQIIHTCLTQTHTFIDISSSNKGIEIKSICDKKTSVMMTIEMF